MTSHLHSAAIVAVLATGTASASSVSAGISVTSSNGLGYEALYPGVTVRGDLDRGAFIARVEASYLWAEKRETDDGKGQSALALAGVRFGSFDALAGVTYSRQETSAWEKDATRGRAELGWNGRSLRAAAVGSWGDGREKSSSWGFRVESQTRVRFVAEYEQIDFTSYFGEEFSGEKITLNCLWTFSR